MIIRSVNDNNYIWVSVIIKLSKRITGLSEFVLIIGGSDFLFSPPPSNEQHKGFLLHRTILKVFITPLKYFII